MAFTRRGKKLTNSFVVRKQLCLNSQCVLPRRVNAKLVSPAHIVAFQHLHEFESGSSL